MLSNYSNNFTEWWLYRKVIKLGIVRNFPPFRLFVSSTPSCWNKSRISSFCNSLHIRTYFSKLNLITKRYRVNWIIINENVAAAVMKCNVYSRFAKRNRATGAWSNGICLFETCNEWHVKTDVANKHGWEVPRGPTCHINIVSSIKLYKVDINI